MIAPLVLKITLRSNVANGKLQYENRWKNEGSVFDQRWFDMVLQHQLATFNLYQLPPGRLFGYWPHSLNISAFEEVLSASSEKTRSRVDGGRKLNKYDPRTSSWLLSHWSLSESSKHSVHSWTQFLLQSHATCLDWFGHLLLLDLMLTSTIVWSGKRMCLLKWLPKACAVLSRPRPNESCKNRVCAFLSAIGCPSPQHLGAQHR